MVSIMTTESTGVQARWSALEGCLDDTLKGERKGDDVHHYDDKHTQ